MSQSATSIPEAGIGQGPVAPVRSLFGLVRHVFVGGLAGVAAGVVVGGVGSRVFMRVAGAASGTRGAGRVTEAGFTVGEVTAGGTLQLVIFIGIISGIVGAVMYLAMQPWIEWAGRWRGVAFGVLLFALTSATSDVMNPDNIDFFILGNAPLLVGLIIALFIAYGVLVDVTFRWLNQRLPGDEEGWRAVGIVYAVLAAFGVLLGLSLGSAILIGGEGVCGCEPPVLATWSFLIVSASTLVLWVSGLVRMPTTLLTIVRVVGYSGTLGILTFGLLRAAADAVEIIA